MPPGKASSRRCDEAPTMTPSLPPVYAHVVVVIQENRSFNNLFNGFPGAHSVRVGKDHLGRSIVLEPAGLQNSTDPNHGHADLVREWDGGKMDGFDLDGFTEAPTAAPVSRTFAYAYVPQSQTTAYWTLASRYAIADHMFSSALSPTFPGHMFLISGRGPADDPYAPAPPYDGLPWGCGSPAGTLVAMFGPDGTVGTPPKLEFPCFDYPTLGSLLDAKGLSWKYYSNNDYPYNTWDGGVGAYTAIRTMYGTAEFTATNVPRYDFFADAKSCSLPAVSYITPDGGASDHAGTFGWTAGPDWVSLIYNAIATSSCSYYGNTALLTWDDTEGWYDDVAPPLDPRGLPLGMRVPLIFIAANAKPHYISTRQHDFGSILHFIESNFGLGSLSTMQSDPVTRDVLADDLSDMWNAGAANPIAPIPFSQLSSTPEKRTVSYYRNRQSLKPVDDR